MLRQLSQRGVHPRVVDADAGGRQTGHRAVLPGPESRPLLPQQSLRLAPGTLGILEPKPELRGQNDRRAQVQELDLLVIPGLAFDRQGGRLGYGKGYFDRLLRDARADALLAAVAFECQLFDAVPMQPYDVRVDAVVTESDIYWTF